MIDERAIQERYEAIRDQLDERGRRLFAAAEARSARRGGVVAVSRATGLARSTIERGLKDLDQPAPPAGRVRRAGSGRQRLTAKDPTLLEDLRRLVEPINHARRPDATAAVGFQEPRQACQGASE